jgi:hypothetical protein
MIATIEPIERKQTVRPLVQYFEADSVQTVAAGEMVHDYYGAPAWLVQHYLEQLGAMPAGVTAGGNKLFQHGACFMQVSPAPCKRIGALEIGGARVEFTGVAGAIQAVLSELEWMTQRW